MRCRLLTLALLQAACAHAGHGEEASKPQPQQAHEHAHTPQHGQGYAKDFSEAEAYARAFDSRERDAWQKPDEVIGLLALPPHAQVADVGAGTGYFLEFLSKAVGPGGRVLALDSEPNMVRHLAQRAREGDYANVEVRQTAADDPGLAERSVDRILIVNTWHHISNWEAYARKLHAALRERGSVLVVDFVGESDLGPPRAYRLAPEEVVRELSAAGFSAEVLEESLPKQYVVIGRRAGGTTP